MVKTKVTEEMLREMIQKRKQGWSYTALAEHFNLGITTVGRHMRPQGLGKKEKMWVTKTSIGPVTMETLTKFRRMKAIKDDGNRETAEELLNRLMDFYPKKAFKRKKDSS